MKFLFAFVAAVVLLCVSQARAAVVYDQIAVTDALGNVTIVTQPRYVPDSVAFGLTAPVYGGGFNTFGFNAFNSGFGFRIDPRFQHFDRFGNVRNNRHW